MTFDPDLATRDQLIEQVYLLRGKLEALQGADAYARQMALQSAFRLTPAEAKLLLLLADGRPKRRDQILSGLYFDRPDDAPESKIIDVFLSKVRSKVEPYGVIIGTIWGSGYQLEAGRAVLDDVFAGKALPSRGDAIEREHPPHLHKRKSGEVFAKALAELQLRADSHGLVTFESREFASKAALNRQVSSIIDYLAQRGALAILKRPPPGGKSRKAWTVRVIGGASAVEKAREAVAA